MKRLALLLTLILAPSLAFAEVQVRDDMAVAGSTTMLAARTKGLILPRGGELVEFIVDGESLGKQLSGGDGWAYREFLLKKEGLLEVEAVSGEEKGAGYLLVLKEGERIVFVDVQGSLTEPPFSKDPMEGSLESLKRISAKYPTVYLSTELPAIVMRKWLEENEFPAAPLLEWRGGGVFHYAVEKGLKVRAIIGSDAVVLSAQKFEGAKLFTFEHSDGATEVDSWVEVEEGLE